MHASLLPGLDHAGQLIGFAFTDQIGRRWGINQELEQRDAPLLVIPFEFLRQHGPQAACQLFTYRLFLLRGKGIHQPLHRLGGAPGVKRRQHQMPGLGGGKRKADCLAVTQFAQQDHIGIFT